ncbi:MAG: protein translocase subunit SecF [Myxococcales bacterium]|nr:protein translocase subunit SecF [Myxococcales bacterium]
MTMNIVKPDSSFEFLNKTRIFGIISVVAVLASLVLMVAPGPNYGIDFAGGTNIIVHYNEDVEPGEITEVLRGAGYDDAVVQRFGGAEEREYMIRTGRVSVITQEQADALEQLIYSRFGEDDTVFDFDPEAATKIEVSLPEGAMSEIPAFDEGTGLSSEQSAMLADMTQAERYLRSILLSSGDFGDVAVSQVGAARHNRFVVRLEQLQSSLATELASAFGARFDGVYRVETVGPAVGEHLRNQGVKAVVLAVFFILVYIALRFNMKFAPGAVVALLHDVIIVIGIFVVLQEEMTLTIVAALLTIVGYSLNDTIVVFDRIRENMATLKTKDLRAIVNQSINECLSRTILTSLTTLIAVAAIFFVGGGLIKSFALAMILGIFVGTYSSIYVASPVMIFITNRSEKREAAKRTAAAATAR